MSPHMQRSMRLPLHFITFAHIVGHLTKSIRNIDVFNAISPYAHQGKVVYGAIFLLENYDFNIRTLDSYSLCSLSALGRNHSLDTLHRIDVEATPIKFNNLDEFSRLLYKELKPIIVQAYVGNQTNPKIKLRLKRQRNLIRQGILVEPFKELYREVSHGREEHS